MSTLNNMLTSVKQNLGNRSSGVIGGTPVDTVVLAALNKGFKNIVKLATPDYYNRIATLSLVVGTNKYAIPTTDVDGNTIKVKQIVGAQLSLTTDTSIFYTEQINYSEFLRYDVPDPANIGIPRVFAQYKDKLYFTKYPDNTYNMTLAVNIIPADFTVNQLNIELGLDDMWYEVLEAYATHYCFSKLQQKTDAAFWYEIYDNAKRECKATRNKQPFNKQPRTDGGYYSANPTADPFVRRFNS